MSLILTSLIAALLTASEPPRGGDPPPRSPKAMLDASPGEDWRRPTPENLLVVDFAGGRRVVIELAPAFAPAHVANIRLMAKSGFYDGLVIERVQDGYVTQLGDPDGKKALPAGAASPAPAEYDRPSAGLSFAPLPYRDAYAPAAGFVDGWPAGMGEGRTWLAHCYGMVGVGRDLLPDTGSGAELYAVIGHSPRHLDRNLAVVGRVLSGMEVLTALPRGTGPLGMYEDPALRAPIVRARIAADMAAAEQPRFKVLRTDSETYRSWRDMKANLKDSFFLRGAGAVDLCNAMPPVRPDPAEPK